MAGHRINNEQAANRKRDIHRPWNVQYALVSIGVLHLNFIDSRSAVGVVSAVAVDLNIPLHEHFALSSKAVNRLIIFVTPIKVQPRAVCWSTGFRVGCDEDFVGQALHMRVGDFTCAVMRGKGLQTKDPKR